MSGFRLGLRANPLALLIRSSAANRGMHGGWSQRGRWGMGVLSVGPRLGSGLDDGCKQWLQKPPIRTNSAAIRARTAQNSRNQHPPLPLQFQPRRAQNGRICRVRFVAAGPGFWLQGQVLAACAVSGWRNFVFGCRAGFGCRSLVFGRRALAAGLVVGQLQSR